MDVENLAIGADIIASSIYYSRQVPRNAIDGDANQYVVNGATCVSTQKEIKPYFIIDLGAECYLTNVKVYKRLDCCPEDVDGFELHLMVRIWKSYGYVSKTDDNIVTFDIYPYVSTRLVRIDGMDDEPAQLQLCEIEVLGITQRELTSDTAEVDDRSNPYIQMRFTLTDKYSDVVKSEDSFIYSMREELSNFTGYPVDSFQNTHVENDPFRVSLEVHPTRGDMETLNELLEKFDTLLQQGVVDMKTEDGQKLTILAGSLKYHVLYLESTDILYKDLEAKHINQQHAGSTTNVPFLMTVIVVILQEAIGALD